MVGATRNIERGSEEIRAAICASSTSRIGHALGTVAPLGHPARGDLQGDQALRRGERGATTAGRRQRGRATAGARRASTTDGGRGPAGPRTASQPRGREARGGRGGGRLEARGARTGRCSQSVHVEAGRTIRDAADSGGCSEKAFHLRLVEFCLCLVGVGLLFCHLRLAGADDGSVWNRTHNEPPGGGDL